MAKQKDDGERPVPMVFPWGFEWERRKVRALRLMRGGRDG